MPCVSFVHRVNMTYVIEKRLHRIMILSTCVGAMTNITNKRSWIHRANAKRVGEKDIDEKFLVIDELRKWQLYGLTDEILYFSKSTNQLCFSIDVERECKSKEEVFQKYFVHKPDILFNKSIPSFIVEIDGSIHEDKWKVKQKTGFRNSHYLSAGFKLVLIQKDKDDKLPEGWEEILVRQLMSFGIII